MHFDPVNIFFQIVVLLFAISVHESAHAWMANRLGDPTAKMLGRVSLNPIVHIDPFGTILVPALLICSGFRRSDGPSRRRWIRGTSRTVVRDDILDGGGRAGQQFHYRVLSSVIALAMLLHGTVRRPFRSTCRRADCGSPLITLFYYRHVDQRGAGSLQPHSVAAAGRQPRHSPLSFVRLAASLMTASATSG